MITNAFCWSKNWMCFAIPQLYSFCSLEFGPTEIILRMTLTWGALAACIPDQQIGRWKASLILDFSKFLSETFLTFGIYDYIKMMVTKPNKRWNFNNKSQTFSRNNVDPLLNFLPLWWWKAIFSIQPNINYSLIYIYIYLQKIHMQNVALSHKSVWIHIALWHWYWARNRRVSLCTSITQLPDKFIHHTSAVKSPGIHTHSMDTAKTLSFLLQANLERVLYS